MKLFPWPFKRTQDSGKLKLYSYLFCCFWVMFRNMVVWFVRFSWLSSLPPVWPKPSLLPLPYSTIPLEYFLLSMGVLSLKGGFVLTGLVWEFIGVNRSSLSNPYCAYLAFTRERTKSPSFSWLIWDSAFLKSFRSYLNSSFYSHRNQYQAGWWFSPSAIWRFIT